MHGEAKEALSRAEEGRTDAEEASGDIRTARGQLEDVRAAADQALAELREARMHAEEATNAALEVLAQASGFGRPPTRAPESFLRSWEEAHLPKPMTREPREGFDDLPAAMATIGLDGHFMQLNPRFSEMVGYSEDEFRSTVWPSVVDLEHLKEHRRLMKLMLGGKLEETEWETSYVHEQGLLVFMAGRLSLVRDDDGEPRHLLFTVD